NEHACAFAQEARRRRLADAAGAARHDDALALEAAHARAPHILDHFSLLSTGYCTGRASTEEASGRTMTSLAWARQPLPEHRRSGAARPCTRNGPPLASSFDPTQGDALDEGLLGKEEEHQGRDGDQEGR